MKYFIRKNAIGEYDIFNRDGTCQMIASVWITGQRGEELAETILKALNKGSSEVLPSAGATSLSSSPAEGALSLKGVTAHGQK
jgi:hypothetical protein